MTRARSSHVDVMRQRPDVAIQRRHELVRDQVNSVADARDDFIADGPQQELLRSTGASGRLRSSCRHDSTGPAMPPVYVQNQAFTFL